MTAGDDRRPPGPAATGGASLPRRMRNALRAALRRHGPGRALLARVTPPLRTLRIVSATRLSEDEFWRTSALGRSLAPWRVLPELSVEISYRNDRGLPEVFNRPLRDPAAPDVLVFVHDDVWLDDEAWISRILAALQRYDVVGVAGNTRRLPRQPGWAFRRIEDGEFEWDHEHLSGRVLHGREAHGVPSFYGPAPAECELLDGVLLAVRTRALVGSGVAFDERFRFHFYDLDLCRQARAAGLSLGTWPITLTHQSIGSFNSPSWKAGLEVYREKWPD